MHIHTEGWNPGFSFLYGERPFAEAAEQPAVRTTDGRTASTVYDLPGGLRVTKEETAYAAYGARRWVLWLENTGNADTPCISELYDGDLVLPCFETPPARKSVLFRTWDPAPPVIWSVRGSTWATDEFLCDKKPLFPGEEQRYACTGGRSSQGTAPYFDINDGDSGYLLAIGWTGQWQARFTGEKNGMHVRVGVEDLAFSLHPGEKIRTASVWILGYTQGQNAGHNAFRRLLKEEFCPIGRPGRPAHGPLCIGGWGGLHSDRLIRRIRKIGEYELGADAYWIDAGWYGYAKEECPDEGGDWAAHTGSWNVNPYYHADGLLHVREAIREVGMQLILWFEPERVLRGTDTPKAHPDWFLEGDAGDNNLLLDLGNEEALEGTFAMLEEKIEALSVDCYRQDFNMDPLSFWRRHDEPGRRGMTEIRHIMGLYRLWDRLLARFPHLYIDNCASGGRRLDIEMMSRSIPLWRSDYQCWQDADPETAQNHNTGLAWWLPYGGTGVGNHMADLYYMRSCYAPSLTSAFWQYGYQEDPNDGQPIEIIRRQFAEYKWVRPYTTGDFYPLTGQNAGEDVWCAWQYDRREEHDGVILAFRRPQAPYPVAVLALQGLEAQALYRVENRDTGETAEYTGRELMETGLSLTIPEKRESRLLHYQRI